MTRSVVAFDASDWSPPEVAVLDTNVIVEALTESEPEHEACAELIDRLRRERTTIVFSRLLEMELWESVFNLALRSEHPRKQVRQVRYEADQRGAAVHALVEARRRWLETLDVLDWIRVELDSVASAVPELMANYGFQSYDAVHVGTLLASGARDLITRDNGFAVLLPEDATIHTTSARVARTRARRRAVRPAAPPPAPASR